MKRASFIMGLLISLTLKSQITLENTYPVYNNTNYAALSVVHLSSGYKYSRFNNVGGSLMLYNLNHSIWKTIPLSVPPGYTLYTAPILVSDSLFKLDPAVELAYTYWAVTYTPALSYTTVTKVIDEIGTTLLTLNQCLYPLQATSTGTAGYKLIAQIDSAGKAWYNGPKENRVYSLPGKLPQNHITSAPSSTVSNPSPTITTSVKPVGSDPGPYLSAPSPNPSLNKSVIAYQLPQGMAQGEIVIYDMTGRDVKHYIVDHSFNTLELDSGELPAGNYLYQMTGVDQARKLLIVK